MVEDIYLKPSSILYLPFSILLHLQEIDFDGFALARPTGTLS